MRKRNLLFSRSQRGAVPLLALIVLGISAILIVRYLLVNSKNTTISSSLSSKNVAESLNLVPQSSASVPLTDQNLNKYLTVEAALLGVLDNISLYYRDLGSDQETTIDPTRSWIPASTIKAYVVLEAFRQRDLGIISFDQPIKITPQNVVPTELETNDYPRLREGSVATIGQLIGAMVTQSDNTAYNTLLDVLDRRNINSTLKNLGFTETVVGEKLNLDDSQFSEDLKVPGRQPNTTTVKDYASLFELLYSGKVRDGGEILDIFKKQKINNMIPALLPSNTVVAHKTGDWAPIYHDGGVVFKPSDPYVLAIFTNSDDPTVVSKMAKVSYFQTADSIGKDLSLTGPNTNQASVRPVISLAQTSADFQVLGDTTSSKTPTITAADLGITPKDLNTTSQQANDFRGAIITPGSFLYNAKIFVENLRLAGADSNTTETEHYINNGKSRLAEAKTLLIQGDIKGANNLLAESEQDLEKATNLAVKDSNKDSLLIEIKQASDLHYAVLAQSSSQIPAQDKEQFVNSVYNFYVQNHAHVAPVVNSSTITNPAEQKPAIGTITNVTSDTATLKFDDGSTKQMVLSDATKVRGFQQDAYQSKDALSTGDKVAVVGLTNSNSEIVPQFILKDVPKELPNKHSGTIIEIDPNKNTLKILNQSGTEEVIQVGNNTSIQSTDTNVSLEGIKAGSQVVIFGTTDNTSLSNAGATDNNNLNSIPVLGGILTKLFTNSSSQSSSSAVPNSSTSPSPTPAPSVPTKLDDQKSSQGTSSASISPAKSAEVVNATTIMVTGNSSGSHELLTPGKSFTTPVANPKPTPKAASVPKTTLTPTNKPASTQAPGNNQQQSTRPAATPVPTKGK